MKRSSSGEENSDVSDLLFPSLVLQPHGVNKCIFDIPTDGEHVLAIGKFFVSPLS